MPLGAEVDELPLGRYDHPLEWRQELIDVGGVYVDPPIVGDKTERQRGAIRGAAWRFAPLEEPPPDLLGLRSLGIPVGVGVHLRCQGSPFA